MSDTDSALARTTAHMLHACAPLAWLNLTLFVLCAWPLSHWSSTLPAVFVVQLLLPLMLVACAFFLHWRIALDAKLFMDFAQQTQNPSKLDESLALLKLRQMSTERDMKERCRCALRLCKRLWIISALQCVWFVLQNWLMH